MENANSVLENTQLQQTSQSITLFSGYHNIKKEI